MAIINPRNQLDLRVYYQGDSKDDRSPYGQTGTLVGTASVGTGALVLDGDSDYLTYPDVASNSLFSRNELTIFAWFNVDTLGATEQQIIAKFDDGDNNKAFLIQIVGTSDILRFAISSDGATTTDLDTTDTISTGTDYLVVATWDGQRTKIYLNGDEKVSTFYSSGIFNSDETISLGAVFNNDSAKSFFNGTIYQAAVLGRALTSQQILNSYLLGKDYRIIDPKKELLFSENFGAGGIPDGYIISGGTFAVEYQNTTGKYYLKCLTGTTITLVISTDNWNGANFADTQTTIAGSPTVTRNTTNVTLTMSAGDGITDVVIRRQ